MTKKQRARARQRARGRREQLRALIAEQRQDRESDWKLSRFRGTCEKRSRYKGDA